MTRRIRIGIDTGGTFTDVVAFDEDSGELVTTKTPSTPSNPADGFLAGIDKVLDLLGATGADIDAVSHGTTVATNQLLEGKVDRLGFITNTGYEAMLEIARQSVPDGYGNSYFWVKPDRIVPRDRVKGVEGRLDVNGDEVRPFDEESARTAARWFRAQGINTLGVCFLHAYANPVHEERMRAILTEEHPDAVVSLSSQVLREYREYERAMTTLVDAAVKPRLSAYVTNIKTRLAVRRRADDRVIPFYVMKSNGGVLSADEVVHQPITTVLSGPAAGALGAALIAKVAGFDKVLTSDGGGTSTDVSVVIDGEPTLTTEGSVGAFPSKIPMIDVVTVGAGGGSIAWLSPEGTLKVGPQSAGADPGPICYGKGGTEVTITDAHVFLGRIPPHLLGGEIPLDVDAARAGIEALAGKLGLTPEACATGVLEISAWNQANALRQVTVKRGLDVRDFTLTTFGGSGSLLLCRLVDVLGLPAVLVPPNPGNVSAFGLLTVDVKNDYVQTHVALADALEPSGVAGDLRRAHRAGRRGAGQGGLRLRRAPVRAHRRPALLRPGLRGPGPGPGRAGRRRRARRGRSSLPRRAHRALRLRLRRRPDPAGRVGQPAGLRHRPDPATRDQRGRPGGRRARRASDEPRDHHHAAGLLRRRTRGTSSRPCSGDRTCHRARVVDRPGDHRGVRLDRPAAPGLHRPHRRVPQHHRDQERQ